MATVSISHLDVPNSALTLRSVDRTTCRTFLTILRDFLLKTRSLPQIKCHHLDDDYFSFNIEPYRANTMWISGLKSHPETARVIKIVKGNGPVRYGTLRWINSERLDHSKRRRSNLRNKNQLFKKIAWKFQKIFVQGTSLSSNSFGFCNETIAFPLHNRCIIFNIT